MENKNSEKIVQNIGLSGRGHRGPRNMAPIEKPKNFSETIKRLWGYFKGEKRLLTFVFLLVGIDVGVGLLAPYLIGKAIDNISPGIHAVDFRNLRIIALVLISVYITDGVVIFFQGWIVAGVSQRIVSGMRKVLFGKLQKLPLFYFDTHSNGEIMSRLTNDIDNISTTISQSTIQLMSGVLNILGALIMMIVLSPLLTVASLVTVPLVLFLTRGIAKKTEILFKEQQDVLGNLNGHIEESISGIQVIKSFNREDNIIRYFENINTQLCEVGTKAQIWSGFIMPMMNVINNFGFAVVAVSGGIMAVKNIITVGIIASFLSYSRQFSRPLNDLANIFNTLQSAVAGAERVFEILDEQEEVEDREDSLTLHDVKGDVEFKNVSFEYKKGIPVLKNINFKVERGSTIALVGPTGAGKTTIVNLLTRFYDVTEGEILIDGKEIRDYTRDSVRRCFGIVLQDTYLFSGTIKDNIKYGKIDASDEEIKEAAMMANAHQFINRMPQGYDTVLLEGGINLSQGERQLIAIARTVLANPSILVLDEATSSIDTRTEFKIQEAMLKIMKNRTTFIIAHRLSTIKGADVIMVVDGGRIVERGSHEEIISKKGEYYRLYQG